MSAADQHFTLVFEGDIRQVAGNPLRTGTPFGVAVAAARGDALLNREAGQPTKDDAAKRIGWWLSAAMDDPSVCAAMKADIQAWFDAGEPTPSISGAPASWEMKAKPSRLQEALTKVAYWNRSRDQFRAIARAALAEAEASEDDITRAIDRAIRKASGVHLSPLALSEAARAILALGVEPSRLRSLAHSAAFHFFHCQQDCGAMQSSMAELAVASGFDQVSMLGGEIRAALPSQEMHHD